MSYKKNFDYDTLYTLYKKQNKSMNEIAEILNTTRITVKKRLVEYDLYDNKKRRDRAKKCHKFDKEILKENLYNDYIINNKTIKDLSNEYNFSLWKTKSLLKQFNIVKRPQSTKSEHEHTDFNVLYDLYVEKNYLISYIAYLLKVLEDTISRQLKKNNIEIKKTNTHSRKGDKYKKNNYYRETLKKLRKLFNKDIRNKAIERDKCTCQICGLKKNLNVHHLITIQEMVDSVLNQHKGIDLSIKENRDIIREEVENLPEYKDLSNLITLCESCHIKIHSKSKV